MVLNTMHTLSGLLLIIFFIGKVILHFYLDHKHYKRVNFLYFFVTPLHYFQQYKKTVDNKFLKLERFCNLLLNLTFFSLLFNIIIGFTIYFKYY